MLCMNSHFSATFLDINHDARPKKWNAKNINVNSKKHSKQQTITIYYQHTLTCEWGKRMLIKEGQKKKGYGTGIHGLFHMCHSYPRNLVPGGPSWRMRLTKLSPSFRGGGAVGRWSLLSSNSSGGKREHKQFGAEFPIFSDIFYLGLPNCGLIITPFHKAASKMFWIVFLFVENRIIIYW